MSRRYLILCGFLLPGISLAQEKQVFTCDAVLGGKIQHKLKIEMLAGKITDFRYTSIAPNGHSCDIGAKRNRKNSDWQDEGQSTVISTRALGQDSGTVRIEKGGNSYKLTVLSPLDLSCGLQGYIAPIVILHTNNKKCELHEAEKNTKWASLWVYSDGKSPDTLSFPRFQGH